MGTIDAQRGAYFLADDRAARLAAAEATLTKVLSFAPNHAMAHCLLGSSKCFLTAPLKASPSANGR